MVDIGEVDDGKGEKGRRLIGGTKNLSFYLRFFIFITRFVIVYEISY